MLRSVLALALSFSVSAPAFAQQSDSKVWESIVKVKEYITAYDSGNGTLLTKVGSKTLLYSFAAYGAASAALTPAPAIAAGATRSNAIRRFYSGWYRVAPTGHTARVAHIVKDSVGLVGASVGVTLLGAAAATFLAQHVWYGWLGHADQLADMTAEQKELASFFSKPAEEIFAAAQADPELGDKLVVLAKSIHVTR